MPTFEFPVYKEMLEITQHSSGYMSHSLIFMSVSKTEYQNVYSWKKKKKARVFGHVPVKYSQI